jgi:predicted adenine nucleotide alpha hydrolase (AANH) superfamily ATPase
MELLQNYEVTLFFCNSNIHPSEEYLKRLEAVQQLAKMYHLPLVIAPYNPEEWFLRMHGLENEPENGSRCLICFQYRLEKTAQFACENNFELFSTTLNLSSYKDITFINDFGEKLGNYLQFDLPPEERLKLSRQAHNFGKQLGLYSQKYCGCKFSVNRKK